MAKRQRDHDHDGDTRRPNSMSRGNARGNPNLTPVSPHGHYNRDRDRRGPQPSDNNANQLAKRAKMASQWKPADQDYLTDRKQNSGAANRAEPEAAREASSQVTQGNVVRGASLLVQLLNEFASSSESQSELRALIGAEATSDVMKLHRTLKPREKAVQSRLHSLPKFPDPDPPVFTFPSRLAEAMDLSVSCNPYTVPALPAIRDASLAAKIFVHRSVFTNDHKRAVSDSYERLELMGDAYIEVMATRLLYGMYPSLPAGRLSGIRETLVCNETLAGFSLAYDFGARARVPDTYTDEGSSRAKIWTKLLGDIFEAYVAAVVVDDAACGFDTAERWLRGLWAPRLPEANVVTDPAKSAKQELQRRLGGVGVRIVYESERDPEPYKGGNRWFIRCVLHGWGFDDQVLGRFAGRSKQVAELGAAEEAMGNPLTAQAQAIKGKFDERVRKEREEEAARKEAAGKVEKE